MSGQPAGGRPGDELVARYDARGHVVGEVVRSVMRRENLWHAASSVVVRDPLGRIYLHRRTPTKDVYPGLLDFAAGGVVLAGEDPGLGAVREVEEELGVHGVALEPVGVVAYEDAHTRYHAHRFTVEWDGPIRWQPEEVVGGEWVDLDALVRRLDDDPATVVPDSAAVWGDVLRGWQAARRG
ncbi:isopentenyldiphosphate isomerase [Humibacillus xanthopallidus]|uniref:Isopentenyldiphosphate isomerase n=1 Tax=Humibacillus xanthopallidus TaxID=412689 RepID=A0A543PS90_9MICO|nr:NUDIX domain-containing protein [Humibacillus xanthopallidus]TQN46939.1 isopentenyldiphosphate isomerase [Humibacillus xanthopallidus]